ncbi:MAG: hypothetical protein ABH885_00090, partial [Candidatus Omnitrophota bacterium]
ALILEDYRDLLTDRGIMIVEYMPRSTIVSGGVRYNTAALDAALGFKRWSGAAYRILSVLFAFRRRTMWTIVQKKGQGRQ